MLTLDKDLQTTAQEAFIAHTDTLRNPGDPPFKGAVVALNPKTGEILAMVSEPTYDPARLLDARERSSYYASLVSNKDLPLFNRAVQGQYGPGLCSNLLLQLRCWKKRLSQLTKFLMLLGSASMGCGIGL